MTSTFEHDLKKVMLSQRMISRPTVI